MEISEFPYNTAKKASMPKKPARVVHSFRYNTGFRRTDGQTHDDSIACQPTERRAVISCLCSPNTITLPTPGYLDGH